MLTLIATAVIAQQHAYRPGQLDRIMEPGHRVICMGDSFSIPNQRNIWPTALKTWPVDLTAFATGATLLNDWTDVSGLVPNVRVDSVGTYEIYRQSPQIAYYTLPLWSVREVYGPVDGDAFTLEALVLDGPLDFRPLFLIDEQVGAGPMQALAGRTATVALDIAAGEYFHLAGGVFAEQPNDGLYYSVLADNSWQMKGFGIDEAGDGPSDKRFSREQLEHWLAATTLDTNQPVTVIYNFAMERRNAPNAHDDYANMVDQTQAAADAIGLSNVWHCIIVPHAHQMTGLTEPEMQSKFAQYHDQAFIVAAERQNVSVVSLWAVTDGIVFDGRLEAQDWLTANGWEEIAYDGNMVNLNDVYGADLLDGADVHLNSQDAGAFWSLLMLDVIQSTPQGDFDGDGDADVFDLFMVLEGWGAWYDVFDLFDVLNGWTG